MCVVQSPLQTAGLAYLYDNTTLDEVVKRDGTTPRPVKLSDQHIIESVRQPVAKTGQSFRNGREREGEGMS